MARLRKTKAHAGQFKPGTSGNPGGRPKSHKELAKYILEHSQDGTELADLLLGIARDVGAEGHVRLRAVEELLDRCVGKAPQTITIENIAASTGDLSNATDDELERMIAEAVLSDAVH